jgi:hypothetical protein
MGGNKPLPRRSFSPQFKAEVVELVRTSGKSIGGVEMRAISIPSKGSSRTLDATDDDAERWGLSG